MFCTQIKAAGYKTLLVYLPCAVLPSKTISTLNRPDGFVNRIDYGITSEIDRIPWGDMCDVGSKPWLVSQAFDGPKNENENGNKNKNKNENENENGNGNKNENKNKKKIDNENERCSLYDNNSLSSMGKDNCDNQDDNYPEDKFHIKLPSNVNQYTGLKMDEDSKNENENENDDFYPEDSFHKRDASSSYIISQREEKIKDKWAKHEKCVLKYEDDM